MRPPRISSRVLCALGWFAVLRLAAPVEAGETIWTVEWLDQRAYDVAVRGSYAYVGAEREFLVVDISNPEAPQRIGRIELPDDSLTTVAAAGSYVLAGNENGDALLVIDVTDPGSPRVASRMEGWNDVQDIAVAWNCAFIVDYDGMTAVDISDPTNPLRISDSVGPRFKHIELSDRRAYVSDYDWGVHIYNVFDPAHPEYVGGYVWNYSRGAAGLQVIGDLAYVVWRGGLKIVSVRRPEFPRGLGFTGELTSDPGGYGFVRISGDTAVVLGEAGVSIVDVSDPSAPAEVGFFGMRFDTRHWALNAGLDVTGPLAFIAGVSNAPVILDISEPDRPRRVGRHSDSFGWARDADVSGDHAFVATTSDFLTVGLVGADSPTIVGSVPLAGQAHQVVVGDDHAYVTIDWIGLQVIAIGDPSHPVVVGHLDLPEEEMHLAVSGSLACIADGSSAHILDVSDPANPARISVVQLPAIEVAIDGNMLVVLSDHANQDGGTYSTLTTFDLADPRNPIPLGSLDHCNSAALAVTGGRAYVEGACGLHVVDISDPSTPSTVASTSGALIYDSIVASGRFIFLPALVSPYPDSMRYYLPTKPETHCFDVADPSDPVPTGHIYPPTIRTASPGFIYGTTDNSFWVSTTDRSLNARWLSGVAADATGKTDLVLLNKWPTDTEIEVTLDTPHGVAEGKAVIPGMSQHTVEIEGMADPGSAGTIHIQSTRSIIAHGHIAQIESGNEMNRFTRARPDWHRTGVPRFYPDPTDWLKSTGWLVGLRQVEGRYSTDLLLTNPDAAGRTATIDITLYATDGVKLTSYTAEVRGGTTFIDPEPLSTRAGRPDLGWGYARIDGCVLASAAVADLRTGDVMTVPVVRDWPWCVGNDRDRQHLWLEIAAHREGRFDSSWRTDVVVLNLTASEAGVELVFHGPDGASSAATTIAGSHQAVFEDVVGLLGSRGKGLLQIRSDQPIAVSGRVYNASDAGTVGHALRGRDMHTGLIAGETAWLAGLRQTEGAYRTNINLSNMGASPATVRITLFTSSGERIADYTRTIPPMRVIQDVEPFANRAGRPDLGWGFARITVERGRRVFVSASIVSDHSNDSIMVAMQR